MEVGEIGTPRKARHFIDLPITLAQPKVQDAGEIDSKMKEIMQLNGILCIDGKVNKKPHSKPAYEIRGYFVRFSISS